MGCDDLLLSKERQGAASGDGFVVKLRLTSH